MAVFLGYLITVLYSLLYTIYVLLSYLQSLSHLPIIVSKLIT